MRPHLHIHLVPLSLYDIILLRVIELKNKKYHCDSKINTSILKSSSAVSRDVTRRSFCRELKSKVLRRTEGSRAKRLLAQTSEPPAAEPAAVATADAHDALVAPAAEGREAPLIAGILPVGAVRMIVCEGRVGFVDRGEGERICGYKAAQFVFLVEVSVADVATAEIELEEDDVRFGSRSPRHGLDHVLVAVEGAPGRGDGRLGFAFAIHGDAADDQVADRFHALAKRPEHVGSQLVALGFEDSLHWFAEKTGLAQGGRQEFLGFADLAGGNRIIGRGHDGSHGVILLYYCSPCGI